MGTTLIAIVSFFFTILLYLIKSPFSFTFSLIQALEANDLVLKSLIAHMYLSTLIDSNKFNFISFKIYTSLSKIEQ